MRPLVLQAHTRPLTRVLYTREGDILYTAGRDKVINCFYEQSGERIGTFEGHNGAVLDICVDEKTEKLVSGSAGKFRHEGEVTEKKRRGRVIWRDVNECGWHCDEEKAAGSMNIIQQRPNSKCC